MKLTYLLLLPFIFLIGCKSDSTNNPNNGKSFGTGCTIDTNSFKKAQIFAKLAGASSQDAVSLRKYAPKRRSQGSQGSCVGWSSSYAARTILQAYYTGENPNNLAFSPSFVYNQIHVGSCSEGSWPVDALELMKTMGDVSIEDFEYDEKVCSEKPSSKLKTKAKDYKISGYNRLTSDQYYEIDLESLKNNIAAGAPVLIAMPVGGTFDQLYGQKVWIPNSSDNKKLKKYKKGEYNSSGLGGHAMCVIGYDNNLEGGCVEIMNSWGEEFGQDGVFFMRYTDFKDWCMEAYGLNPFPKRQQEDKTYDFEADISLIFNKTKDKMAVEHDKDYYFETKSRQKVGSKFKVELTNTMECYTYVIGQETDLSTYVLFPYTKQHSAYCGITGTRVFPKDYSMQLDELGSKDVIAIILSKKELDIEEIKDKMNNSRGDFSVKLKKAIGRDLVDSKNLVFKDGKTISLKVKDSDKDVIPIVLGISK